MNDQLDTLDALMEEDSDKSESENEDEIDCKKIKTEDKPQSNQEKNK